jgi:hypothetical protein
MRVVLHAAFHASSSCCSSSEIMLLGDWEITCTLLLVLQISRVQKMLGDEYGTASNIKSRVNRLSVLGAITSAQQRLKLYNKVCALQLRYCSTPGVPATF